MVNRLFCSILIISIVLISSACAGTYSGGTGEPNDPYLIATAEDLNSIGAEPNDWGKHFKMIADINLAVLDEKVNTISTFTGVFDGNNHVISKFRGSSRSYNYGLFGYVVGPNSIVKNIELREPVLVQVGDLTSFFAILVNRLVYGSIINCRIKDLTSYIDCSPPGSTVAGIVGQNYYGTVVDCVINGELNSERQRTGGIVALNEGGIISNCQVDLIIEASDYTGGIVGYNDGGQVINCNADVNIIGRDYTGGIVGYNDGGQVINCNADVNIIGNNYYIGGLIGYSNSGVISECSSTGIVSSEDSYIGGLIGKSESGTITGCSADVEVSGLYSIGGLIGYSYEDFVENCSAIGNVTASRSDAGGLCGNVYISTLSGCYAAGDIKGRRNTGGLCGENIGDISNSYATGSVNGGSGDHSIGGLCGENHGDISNCYATGSVSVGDDSGSIGGLCGGNYGDISNCYSSGSVSGGDNSGYIGGLCGSGGTISKSYSVGEVHLDNPYYPDGQPRKYGGLCGSGDSNDITDSYYLKIAAPDNGIGTGLSNNELMDQNNFAGWDFVGESVNGPNDYWDIIAGNYPKLSWQAGDGPQPHEKYYSGGFGCLQDPFKISCVNDLLFMGEKPWHMSSHFLLTNDIDLADLDIDPETPGKQELAEALISSQEYFSGVFDGNNYSIRNLTINASDSSSSFLGLFDVISGKVINLGVEDVNITASSSSSRIGGLCGRNDSGLISNCYTTGVIQSFDGGGSFVIYTGGLCGLNFAIMPDFDVSMITNCYSTVNITGGGDNRIGGLCGFNHSGLISNSYATGSVTGNYSLSLGGLCGGNYEYGATIINCYATGSITGGDGSTRIGGLCGENRAIISNSYSTGSVTGGDDPMISLGGFCGINRSDIGNCYFLETAGPNNGPGTPLTDGQMKQEISFSGWDFIGESINGPNDIWAICEGTNYPRLTWSIPKADFLCPDGVDFIDYSYFVDQWMLEVIAEDVTLDGIVNFQDYAVIAGDSENLNDYEQVRLISENWLKESADKADIAPAGGDKIVDWEDLAEFCQLWLEGIE